MWDEWQDEKQELYNAFYTNDAEQVETVAKKICNRYLETDAERTAARGIISEARKNDQLFKIISLAERVLRKYNSDL